MIMLSEWMNSRNARQRKWKKTPAAPREGGGRQREASKFVLNIYANIHVAFVFVDIRKRMNMIQFLSK